MKRQYISNTLFKAKAETDVFEGFIGGAVFYFAGFKS